MPVLVAEDLDLDMAGTGDHLFQVAFAIAKGGFRLAPAFQHLFLQLVGGVDRAHAPAAATPRGLEHQRIADLGSFLGDGVHVVAQHLGRGDDRHASLDSDLAGRGLVTKRAHRLGFGPDEGDARVCAGVHEIGIFRQQAIARMDRVRAAVLGHADDFVDRQVGLHGAHAFADAVGLVGLETVQGQLVLFGKDGDGALAHFVGRAHHADGDLTPVCHQNLAEIGHAGSRPFLVLTRGR